MVGSVASPAREALVGLVERLTYHNADNGFCVLQVKARGHRDLVTVVGHAAMINPGEFIQASGVWVNDRKHGPQFKAQFLKAAPPTTAEGIKKYFAICLSGAQPPRAARPDRPAGGELERGVLMYQCAGCRKQTSVTAGTVLHRSHLPLKVWFLAAWLVATHRNGISARQLWLQLGLGSYKTAWLLLQKLRRAMIAPDRSPLSGLVEVDETSMPFRTKDTPINPKPGRSHEGKMMIAGAVEIHDKAPGRLRLKVIDDYSANTLGAFVHANLVPGSTAISDGWSGYLRLKDVKHEPRIVGPMAAHVLLPWIHRVFGNTKRWAMGVYHGLREPHLQRYLDEFVFRFNRRQTPQAAFASLLGIAVKLDHASYQMLIQRS